MISVGYNELSAHLSPKPNPESHEKTGEHETTKVPSTGGKHGKVIGLAAVRNGTPVK